MAIKQPTEEQMRIFARATGRSFEEVSEDVRDRIEKQAAASRQSDETDEAERDDG